ncbi:MAG TPA: DinB family protein [Cyclobacteriaceae bacterium]|jgi:uncharacterized damage-inducible protein DinB|nr:DinB family protein [Cyclobacteriaceae bacterium]
MKRIELMEIQSIISLLQKSYEHDPWHGPSIKDILEGITEEQSLRHLPNTHSICELVAHMIVWREFVSLKLQGDKDFKMTDDLNFPIRNDWNEVLKELEKSQKNLVALLKQFPETRLRETVPSVTNQYTFYTLLHGLIHHDIYHAGQISLIKKVLF